MSDCPVYAGQTVDGGPDCCDLSCRMPPAPVVEGFTKVSDGGAYGYHWRSPRWRCDVCGRTGYGVDDGSKLYAWADACRRGHSPCVWCGQNQAVRLDGTPRVHTRCPNRPDDAELLRLLAAEVKDQARRGVRGPLDRQSVALLERLTTLGQS